MLIPKKSGQVVLIPMFGKSSDYSEFLTADNRTASLGTSVKCTACKLQEFKEEGKRVGEFGENLLNCSGPV